MGVSALLEGYYVVVAFIENMIDLLSKEDYLMKAMSNEKYRRARSQVRRPLLCRQSDFSCVPMFRNGGRFLDSQKKK